MRLTARQLHECVGWEARYTAPEPLGAAAIRYFALAVDDRNPLYVDADAARRAGYETVIAPPTLICETNQHMARRPDRNGYIGHSWDLGLEDCRWVRGGNEYEFGRPLRPSDTVTVAWRLVEAANKTSRSGEEMVMILSEATYADQTGEFLARNLETMFYF
jgi:acyl dehydratase